MSGHSSIPPVASLSVPVAAGAKPAPHRPVIDLPDVGAPPIFIHSSWRTSSTWLWTKLRQAPRTLAYCEIFHERLERMTIEELRKNDFSGWNSKHPEGAPYFLEFAQLIEDGAIPGFDRSMAFDRFIPEDGPAGPLSAPERAYVARLIEHAYSRNKIPVLADTRTLGRFAALALAFPGRHALLIRNVFHQWGSYAEQWAQGNNYFLGMLRKTVEASRHDPFVRLLSDWFVDEDRSPSSAATFQLFLLFHLYLYAHAFDSADLVVDVNRIAAEPEHRAAVEERLSEWVLSPIDLSDARPAFGLSLFAVDSKAAFTDVIDQFVKQMIDGSMSDDAARFVTRTKDEALAEWERHEFYSATLRNFSVRRLRLAEEAPAKPRASPAPSATEEVNRQIEDRSGNESGDDEGASEGQVGAAARTGGEATPPDVEGPADATPWRAQAEALKAIDRP